MAARRAHNPEVGGSSPPSATRNSPESHDSGELVIFARSRAFAFRKDKRAIPDALVQAPLQAKPNYTNVMRYCPRLVRQYASKAAAVSGSRFAGCRSLLRTRKFLQNMGFAQKHLSAFILLCFVISRYMMRRSMDHSGENRIQKTQCIPSRCLTTAPLPFCVIRVELDEAAAPVDWTFLYCNDALAALEGYPKDKLLGQRFFQLFPDGDRKWLKPYYEAAYEKRAAAFDSISEEIGQYLHELMANPVYNSSVTLRRLKALRTQDGTVDFECVINNRKGHSTSLVVHTEVVTSPQGSAWPTRPSWAPRKTSPCGMKRRP